MSNISIKEKHIRVFYSNRARAWIIANDKKLDKLMKEGYSYQSAKFHSHGHMSKKSAALKIKKNIIKNKRTTKRDLWTLECYLRVADSSYKYYSWTKGLLETRQQKGQKEKFVRVNKGPV